MDNVAIGFQTWLQNNSGYVGPSGISIDSVLAEFGLTLQNVYTYEKFIKDAPDLPALEVGNCTLESTEFDSAPWIVQSQYLVPINGYVIWEDQFENALLLQRFFKATKRLFEDKAFEKIPTPKDPNEQIYPQGDYPYLHFNAQVPVVSGSLEYEGKGQGPFLRMFTLNIRCYELRQVQPGYTTSE